MLKLGRYLSPVEVREQRFQQKFRGYDAEQVDDFMLHLSSDYEGLYRENQELAERVQNLEEELGKYKKLEDNVQTALVTAQQAAKQVQINAQAQGELIVGEARLEADKIKQAAKEEVAGATQRLAAIKNEAITFRSQLRALIMSFQELLEFNLPTEEVAFLQAAAAKEEDDDCSGGDCALPAEGSREGESDSGPTRPDDPREDGDPQSTARFSFDGLDRPGGQ